MFSRIGDKLALTWSLLRSAWRHLRGNPRFLVFPLLAGVCSAALLVGFGALGWLGEPEGWRYYVQCGVMGFALFFVVTFFEVALVGCVVLHASGQVPSVGDGLRIASRRLVRIAGWALLTTLAAVLLEAAERNRAGKRTTGWLLRGVEFGWSVLTYLAVPVLTVEEAGPIDALRTSTKLLKQAWGPQLVSRVAFHTVLFVLIAPVMLALALLAAVGGLLAAGVAVVVGVVYVVSVYVVVHALETVFKAALYLHMRHGRLAEGFYASDLQRVYGPAPFSRASRLSAVWNTVTAIIPWLRPDPTYGDGRAEYEDDIARRTEHLRDRARRGEVGDY